MKIIGEANQSWIMEISKEEAANLCGFSSNYCDEVKKFQVGSTVKIGKVYEEAVSSIRLMNDLSTDIERFSKNCINLQRKIEIKAKEKDKN